MGNLKQLFIAYDFMMPKGMKPWLPKLTVYVIKDY